jgi:hypothetical protein
MAIPVPGEMRRCAVAAALAYLVLVGWWMHGVLADPAGRVLGAQKAWNRSPMMDTDQHMVISVINRHAHLLAARPTAIASDGNCFPTPASYTLGEHMFGSALLAALPLALTGDPIVAYNACVLLSLWIAALAMYALSVHFTRSPPAAFVAGLLFAFGQTRLSDPVHHFVAGGDLWAPLALLFLHRLFGDGTWRSALGFALFFSLLMGESLYALLSSSILVALLGLYLVARDPRRLRAIAPQLAFAGALIGVIAWLVFTPYLTTAATWGGMRRNHTFFAPIALFALGRGFFPGVVVLALAALGLLDRLRGARRERGYDPRLIFLAAGLLIVWSSVAGIRLLGVQLPSPLGMLREHVPGLDAVRVLAAVRIGCYLVAAFLAGYGVLAVAERVGRRAAIVLAGAASVLGLLEVGNPAFATFSFGRPPRVEARTIALDERDLALVTSTAQGAVLDLPHRKGFLLANAHHLLLSAYHQRPSSACYNSFSTPLQGQIERLAVKLPARRAAEELAALGFRTLFVHRGFMKLGWAGRQPDAIAEAAARPGARLSPLGSTAAIDAYRLEPPATTHSEIAALAPAAPGDGATAADEPIVAPGRAQLSFPIWNRDAATFVHPAPLVPTDLVVTWWTLAGQEEKYERVRALLPLAIASGAIAELQLELSVLPAPGRYAVTVARASDPGTILSRISLRVEHQDPP